MSMQALPQIDRRTTLKWLLAGIGVTPALAACGAPEPGAAAVKLLGMPKPISGLPYGVDPDLMEPKVTWDLTMTPAQKQLSSALTDLVMPAGDGLPAGSAFGISDFIDEWVSSPYEKTRDDRERLFALFEWLEGEAGEAGFAAAPLAEQQALLDRIAWKDRVEEGLADQAAGFDTFRNLSVSAYFSSEEGAQWLGYLGNRPAAGDYAGPTEEALEHLQAALEPLGLTLPEGL